MNIFFLLFRSTSRFGSMLKERNLCKISSLKMWSTQHLKKIENHLKKFIKNEKKISGQLE